MVMVRWLISNLSCVNTDNQLPTQLHHHQFLVYTLISLQLEAKKFLFAHVSICVTSLLFESQEHTGFFSKLNNADPLKPFCQNDKLI